MSREAWRAFLAADGVEDWVVLHGGPAAAYAVDSLAAAAALAQAVAEVPGLAGSVGDTRLSVRLTRGVELIEPHHVDLARAVSEVARQHGAAADRGAVQEVQVAVAARPDELDIGFWRAVLGYVDVSLAREHAEARLAAALAAGGRVVDESEAPAAWILADRAGNKVCIAAWPDGSGALG